MKLALIGATGFVGTQVLNEALQRGHEVTAIVRNTSKLELKHPSLTVISVDVHDTDALAVALAGHDMVISAYNAGWQNPNIYEDFLKGSASVETATQKAGVKRLLVVGGAGSLEAAPGVQLVDTAGFPAEWKPGALAARDYLNELKKNDVLDWTFLSPAIMLHPGERTGVYRTGTDTPVFNEKGESTITAADLAVALVDEAEKGQFIRRRFTVGY